MENYRLISIGLVLLSILSILAFFIFNFPFPFLFLFFPPLLFRAGRKNRKLFAEHQQSSFCSNCGYQLSPHWTFCPSCSHRQ
ncbi:MAG: zinc-ribbon domain-containing protein [Candidatus Kariarchaeaceae archaeon]